MAIDVLVVDNRYVDSICENLWFDLKEKNQKLGRKDVIFHTSFNGNIALDKVRERPYDLVVLDFQMPGMNGAETAAKLREIRPDIVLAGNSTHWNQTNAEEAGLVAYGAGTYTRPIVDYISQLLEESKKHSGKRS